MMIDKECSETVIIVFSQTAFFTAKRICKYFPHFVIHVFDNYVTENNPQYNYFKTCIQKYYKAGKTIIALCATGIVIKSLASLLIKMNNDPPVLVISENGSYIVPLLGIKNGANLLARELEKKIGGQAAITTNKEELQGNILYPLNEFKLLTLQKKEYIRIIPHNSWLASLFSKYKKKQDSQLTTDVATFVVKKETSFKGCVFVVGLGPGNQEFRSIAVNQILASADDIIGYAPYIDLASPFSPGQHIYKSDNRQEIERSRYALNLAAKGRNVVLVSSGDPGVYGMSSTLFEVLEFDRENTTWDEVNLVIEPGVSAAFAASAKLGAPIGHDFAIISLSDNLKPWSIIEKRLRLSVQADMVLVLYNPVSKKRKHQIEKTVDLLFKELSSKTFIALAHDIGRKEEKLKITTLEKLKISEITSHTVIFVGSTKTRLLKRNGKEWLYTPRHYL